MIVDDDTPGGAGAIPDVVRAATSAKHPQLKKFYTSTSVACDRITLEGGRVLRVVPLPYVWEKDREKFRTNPEGFGAAPLDEENKAGEPQSNPIAPGIPRQSVSNMIVLDYGTQESLDWIRRNASEATAHRRLQRGEGWI